MCCFTALTLYQSTFVAASDPSFVLFQDAASGAGMYASGRYLEATLSSADRVLLGFDYAYSPRCVYYPERYR